MHLQLGQRNEVKVPFQHVVCDAQENKGKNKETLYMTLGSMLTLKLKANFRKLAFNLVLEAGLEPAQPSLAKGF